MSDKKLASSVTCHLSPVTSRRYARHIVLPEIGETGQEKLLASSVLVIGAGGLGSAALAYLAAAGIGRLGIVEPDRVELSNLQRQVLFEEADIGRAKIEAAADRIHEVNPDCEVELFAEWLTKENAQELIKDFFSSSPCLLSSPRKRGSILTRGSEEKIHTGADAPLIDPRVKPEDDKSIGIVLDCTDNFATRFALADACLQAKKTLVSAAISGFSGQLSTFKPHLGAPHPCYRCLVPDMPEREITCEQEGIIGPLAGVMGSMQALEAVKELLGIGESLSGWLLLMDALSMNMRKVVLPRDPHCAWCK